MDEEPGFQLPANAHLNLGGRQRKGRPSNAESEPVPNEPASDAAPKPAQPSSLPGFHRCPHCPFLTAFESALPAHIAGAHPDKQVPIDAAQSNSNPSPTLTAEITTAAPTPAPEKKASPMNSFFRCPHCSFLTAFEGALVNHRAGAHPTTATSTPNPHAHSPTSPPPSVALSPPSSSASLDSSDFTPASPTLAPPPSPAEPSPSPSPIPPASPEAAPSSSHAAAPTPSNPPAARSVLAGFSRCPHCPFLTAFDAALKSHLTAAHPGLSPAPQTETAATFAQNPLPNANSAELPKPSPDPTSAFHACPHCPFLTGFESALASHISAVHSHPANAGQAGPASDGAEDDTSDSSSIEYIGEEEEVLGLDDESDDDKPLQVAPPDKSLFTLMDEFATGPPRRPPRPGRPAATNPPTTSASNTTPSPANPAPAQSNQTEARQPEAPARPRLASAYSLL